MPDKLLLSERVYIALYAHTGKWRAKRLPVHVIELGRAERAKHKRGERCMGCEMQRFDLVIGSPRE
jgi:hypothetical protein